MTPTDTSAPSGAKDLRVTLLKSLHGQLKMHRNNVNGLGLTRRHQTRVVKATPEVMGMVNASAFMLKIEDA